MKRINLHSTVIIGRRLIVAVTGLLVCLGLATSARAVDNTWNAGTTGYWTNGANWSTGVFPGNSGTLTNVFIDGGNSLVSTVKVQGVVNWTLGGLTISAGDVLQIMNVGGSLRPTVMTNDGVIQVVSGTGFSFQTASLRNSGIMEAVGGELAYSPASGGTLNNTGGVIRATSGSFLVNRSNVKIVGGNLYIASTATNNIIGTTSAQADLTLDGGVIATNAGYTVIKTTSLPGAAQNRNIFLTITNGSQYVNLGTIDIVQDLTNAMNGNVNMRMRVETGGELKNTGTINISQLQTNNAGGWAIPVYLQMNVAGFQNDGTITINTKSDSTDTAQFRSTFAITNAGNIVVQGPKSSIEMGALNLTQTAGSLVISNGGQVKATVILEGGDLTGDGTVVGNVTLNGGNLKPGNGIGTLTVSNLTLSSSAGLFYELGATNNSDKVIANGTLNLGGLQWSQFTWSTNAGFGDGTYTLIDATGLSGSLGSLTNGTIGGLSSYLWVDGTANDLMLTVIPEPSALVLCGLGLALSVILARRRRGPRATDPS